MALRPMLFKSQIKWMEVKSVSKLHVLCHCQTKNTVPGANAGNMMAWCYKAHKSDLSIKMSCSTDGSDMRESCA